MKPPAFEYKRPETLQSALALLAEATGDTKILAGGQSLVPLMNFRLASPDVLVDINRVAELDYFHVVNGELTIGALARHAQLYASEDVRRACPLLHEAYGHVAHGAIRNRGTLCGNLCHADPASELPAIMLAVEAEMVLLSSDGERRIPAAQFFEGFYQTATRANEILVRVCIPVAPANQGWAFHEMSVRHGDFAIVAVGATLICVDSAIERAALVVAGLSQGAVRLTQFESQLIGRAPTLETFRDIATQAAITADAQSDVHADEQYRRDLVRTLLTRALLDAAGRT